MEEKDLISLQQKVTLLRAEGKYKETIEAGFELLEVGIEQKHYKSILTAYINNAAAFYSIGAIEEALKNIDLYKEVCAIHGDQADWVNLYNVSFLVYEVNKDYKKAKETLIKSVELAKELKAYNIVSNGYSNLSHVYLIEKNYNQAIEMAQEGLEYAILHKPESLILQFRVKLNLAKAYIANEDLDAAKLLIDEIIQAPILESFQREKAQCHDLLGVWYVKNKLYEKAFESYTTAKNIVEEYNDVHLLKTIQEERSKLCELMDNVELGYIVQKEYIALLNEISEREIALTALKLDIKHNVSAIQAKAEKDYLTGVYNRNYLEETVDRWLHANEIIQCLALDIDDFKGINDTFGHLFGDEIIKQVGIACTNEDRENELVGRYGGDEFIVFLKDATLEEALDKAKEIESKIRSFQIVKEGKSVSIQVSIGIANNLDQTITSFKDLFHLADLALYKAKKEGKNQISVSK